MRLGFFWLALNAILALGPIAPARSQDPAESRQPPTSPPSAEGQKASDAAKIEPGPIDTILLRDNKGNLVPVLGMSFEEFEQLLRVKKGLAPAAAPDFTLDRLSLVGTAREQSADFDMTATIRLRRSGWTRVPLRLLSAVIREPPKHQGSGDFFFDFDADLGGYVCWFNSSDSQPHVITMQLSTRLTGNGTERRLVLPLPHATESSLRLTAPEPRVDASLAAGDGIVTSRAASNQTSEIAILGPAGDLQLVWRPVAAAAKGPAQLDVNGEFFVRIQSERRMTAEARLRVRGSGAPLEAFRVRLPPGMELLPLPPNAGYSATPLPSRDIASEGNSDTTGQLIEVRLERPSTTVAEVQLRASPNPDSALSAPLMPAQFEVQDAVRQRGTIDFSIDGEWQLDWIEDATVHRIDVPTESASARVVARFEYFRQPCGLQLNVAPRQSRITVEPTHLVFVEPQHVRIETLLKYRFRGTRAGGLSFDLRDWKLDRITPDTLLDVPVTVEPNGERVNISFRAGVAPPSELELKLEAHLILPMESQRVTLAFPRPIVDTVAPANILVFASDGLELTLDPASLVGLFADATPNRWPGPDQPRFVFRDFGSGEPAQFVAAVRHLSRSTTSSARATIRLERLQLQIEQVLDYRIAHEPQRRFLLTCPSNVIAGGNLQIGSSDEPLSWMIVPDSKSADGRLQQIEFTARTDQIGAFRAVLRYSLPLVGNRNEPFSLELPLVLPLDQDHEQFIGQQLEFALAEGTTLEPDSDVTDESSQPAAIGGGPSHVYDWSDPNPLSRWLLEPAQVNEGLSNTVSQMWVQTWLTADARQERVAFRLTPLRENIRIRLPSHVRDDSLQTAVDGQRVLHNAFRETRQVLIPVAPAARGRECVVEVFYALDPPATHWGVARAELQTAKIEDALPPRRAYWQIAMTDDRHLLLSSSDMTSEMAWVADRWSIGPRPVLDQRQLEAWIKASRQAPLPRALNEYLFGALGRWPTLTITTIHRRVIASMASAFVLGLGLLLIHVPRMRHPSVLLVLATLLAAATIVFPQAGLLVAQGAVLGIVVVILAAVLAWLVPGRPVISLPQLASQPQSRESSVGPTPRPEPGSRTQRSSRITATAPPATQILEARP